MTIDDDNYNVNNDINKQYVHFSAAIRLLTSEVLKVIYKATLREQYLRL